MSQPRIPFEFGNFRDNEAAFRVACADLKSGAPEKGRRTLARLLKHIESSRESKSQRILVDDVKARLVGGPTGPEWREKRQALDTFCVPERYHHALVRVVLERTGTTESLPSLTSPTDIYQEFGGLSSLDREVFLSLLLDQKNRVTGLHVISVGNLSSSLVHPREVFKAAILGNAARIVLIHNHPSGNPEPSRDDIRITRRLCKVGHLHGIMVEDHIVIASDGYVSFKSMGLL